MPKSVDLDRCLRRVEIKTVFSFQVKLEKEVGLANHDKIMDAATVLLGQLQLEINDARDTIDGLQCEKARLQVSASWIFVEIVVAGDRSCKKRRESFRVHGIFLVKIR